MLKTIISIMIFTVPLYGYGFFIKSESESEICKNYIYKFLKPNPKFKPSIQEVRATLGNKTNNIAYTHIYYWYNVTVVFLNDRYIEHIGTLYVDLEPKDYHKITPDHVIKNHGKPMKIEQEHTIFQKWTCKRGISNLEIVLSKGMQAARYKGRYCSEDHEKYCRYFEYSNN